LKKLDKLRYLLYTVKKLSGCFSSRPTISFFITVVEFTEIFFAEPAEKCHTVVA
jgi:hypothetical protein